MVIYVHVSKRKQLLNNLQTQAAALSSKYSDHFVITDCGSRLNSKRKGLLSILQLAFEGRLQLVCITYRDSLCSFAYDLIEHILHKDGAEICVEAHDFLPPTERELAKDVLFVITIFGARLYGARRTGRRGTKRKAQETSQKDTKTEKELRVIYASERRKC